MTLRERQLASHASVSARDHCWQTALALIAFSNDDPAMRRTFSDHLRMLRLDEPLPDAAHTIHTLSRFLLPRTKERAYELMQWLSSELVRDPDRTRGTRALLAAWAADAPDTEPKNIVIGLIGLAIPGPTLGIIKKMQRDSMVVLVRRDIVPAGRSHTIRAVQRASLGLLAEQLQAASGAAYRLHPDLAHWFFGEKETTVFTARSAVLEAFCDEVRDDSLAHYVHTDEKGVAGVALSPAVDPRILTGRPVTPLA